MLHTSVSAQKLGAVRIAVFAILLVYVLLTPLERFASLPAELHVRMGLLRLLPDEAWAGLRSAAGLSILRGSIAAGAVLCVLGTRGYRVIAAITVALWLVFEASLYLGAASHRELATLYCAMLLAVFPAADGLSLRARRSSPRGSPALYAAALQLMTFSLLLTYAVTAFYRLAHGSPEVFWDGSMVAHLVSNSGRNGTFGFTHGVELVRALGGSTWVLDVAFFVGTLLEALAPLCMLSRPFRRAWLGFVLAFHTANWLAMNIEFFLNSALAVVLLVELDPWRSPSDARPAARPDARPDARPAARGSDPRPS